MNKAELSRILTCLAQSLEMRDPFLHNHSVRVTQYAMLLGQQLNLSADDIDLIRIGAPLHDIGMIGIEDAILRKPGRLTGGEFEIMKTHAIKGVKIIEQVPGMAGVIPILRSHHERWDGQGYPDGLQGQHIPYLARIVTVAEAFDAMTSDTHYREALPAEAAFVELEKESGRQFDPNVTTAFLAIRPRILQELPIRIPG